MQPHETGNTPLQPQPVQPPVQQTPLTPEKPTKKREGFRSIATTIAILIAAPLVALFITSFLFQSYEVFGPSMQNTMHGGDRLIVVKAPRTWARLWHRTYMPERGQIVIFDKPGLNISATDDSDQLIKRVMALPGERVHVGDGVLTVYNDAHPEGFQPDKDNTLGYTIKHTGMDGDWTVGPGQVFVCGDNRDNSLDSRTFGPIDTKDIVGTAAFRFLPVKQARTFK